MSEAGRQNLFSLAWMGMAREDQPKGSSLSVQTLLISAGSAVAATLVVSQFWAQGTLLFTAMIPVVVAVTTELLKRPAKGISKVAQAAAPRALAPRRTRDGTEVREPEMPEETRRTLPPEPDPFGLREAPAARPWHADRRVRLGIVTGLAAFLIAAAAVTASELTLGGSVGGGDRRTTFLGGDDSSSSSSPSSSQEREAEPDATATPTPEEEATPEPSVTPEPTPEETPPPAEATPAPEAAPPAAPEQTPAPQPTPP